MNRLHSPDSVAAGTVGLWPPTWTLWRREMTHFLRQKHRVASALLTPVILWLFLGVGLNHTVTLASPAATPSYLAYLLPGTTIFIILSTAIFSTISIIEDRRAGFLQSVLVSPAPRLAIVLGKVLGGATLALGQAVLFLLIWPFLSHGSQSELPLLLGRLALAVGVLAVLAVQLTAWGVCLAWPMTSTSGFHALMMLLLMPAWFLSGAIFPLTGTPAWLYLLMSINPLTYGQAALTGILTGDPAGTLVGAPVNTAFALFLTGLLTLGSLLLATLVVARPRADGLA